MRKILGKIACSLGFHKWKSERFVLESELADLQPEEGNVVSSCQREDCLVAKGSILHYEED